MKHTEETKKNLSEKRKQWLLNNKDNHPWKSNKKFISKPCEHLKSLLKSKNIQFIPEYSPLKTRNFSIDIAFPDKMIGLEVNGNQHYEKGGALKPYYKERHELIENAGWKLYEIHYTCVFNEKIILPIIKDILENPAKLEFDYLNWVPEIKEKNHCIKCNKKISNNSVSGCCKKCKPQVPRKEYKRREIKQKEYKSKCQICNLPTNNKKFCSPECLSVSNRKVKNKPSKEELHSLVWEFPTIVLAKRYNISDKAIEKWCKNYEIIKPPRGYWAKKKYGKL